MTLLLFLTETSIVNTVPIVLAMGFVAYVAGTGLRKAGAGWRGRTLLYALVGAWAGFWAYVVYDAAEREVTALEVTGVWAAMYLYASLWAGAAVLIRFCYRRSREPV